MLEVEPNGGVGDEIMALIHEEHPSLAALDQFRRWLSDIVEPNLDIQHLLSVDRDGTVGSMRALLRFSQEIGSSFEPANGCNAGVLALWRMVSVKRE